MLRSLEAARKAATLNDLAASRELHTRPQATPEAIKLAISAQETHKKAGDNMKTIIFGGLDGIITTFAVVAGAGGGGLSEEVVLIMGFSSLVADALSMGVGDALSSKAEAEVAVRERQREEWEMDNYLEGEISEMIDIYRNKGMSADDAEMMVRTLAKYKARPRPPPPPVPPSPLLCSPVRS